MLISLSNQQPTVWVSDAEVQVKKNLIFDNTSKNIAGNYTFALLVPDTISLTSLNVSVAGSDFNLAVLDQVTPVPADENSLFIEAQSFTEAETNRPTQNNTQIWQWNVMIYNAIAGLYSDAMTVSYTLDGTAYSYEINLQAEVIDIDTKYLTLVQNFKFDITPDYYTAFFDSEHLTDETDEILMNQKRKEFVLNYFELTAQTGSYRTLLNALEYFGYGDLVELREIWHNEELDRRQSTKITTEVLDHIDNRLLGYKKTNQIQLIYNLNEWDFTFDLDGLENYVTVQLDDIEYLYKMFALRRVLEKDFLPLNTKIVDIIGQHTSVAGVDANLWLNQYRLDETDMNETTDGGYTFANNQREITIGEHEVMMRENILNVVAGPDTMIDTDDDLAEYPAGVTQSDYRISQIFFEVDEWISENEPSSTTSANPFTENYDYVKFYHRSDFGMVKITTDFDETLYNRYIFELYDVNVSLDTAVYTSPLRSISDLVNRGKEIHLGIRQVGTFKLVVYLFDFYGGMTIMNHNNQTFDIINREPSFNLARVARQDGFYKSLDLYSTFESIDNTAARHVVIDAIDDTLDINTFDELTHTNQVIRFYHKSYDRLPLHLSNFEFNSIPVQSLTNTSLYDYGYEFANAKIDMIGDGTDDDRIIQIRLRDHDDWDIISVPYDNITYPDPKFYYRAVLDAIAAKPADSIWHQFTWQIGFFSPDLISQQKMILHVVAKTPGRSANSFRWDLSQLDTFAPIVTGFENWYSVTAFSAYMLVHTSTSGTINGDLNIVIYNPDGTEMHNFTETSVDIDDGNDLVDMINQAFLNNSVDQFLNLFEFGGEIAVISSMYDLKITHPSFGTAIQVARGKEASRLEMIPAGSDFYRGQPFYAFIDLATKIYNADITWTLKDSLTGDVIDVQNTYVYRYIPLVAGAYDLEMTATDMFGTTTKTKNGFVLVS